jgi:hypothetical protein
MKKKIMLSIVLLILLVGSLGAFITSGQVVQDADSRNELINRSQKVEEFQRIKEPEVVSFEELHNHLAEYIGKEVSIIGYVDVVIDSSKALIYHDVPFHGPILLYVIRLISIDTKLYRGWYKATGIIQERTWITAQMKVNDIVPL